MSPVLTISPACVSNIAMHINGEHAVLKQQKLWSACLLQKRNISCVPAACMLGQEGGGCKITHLHDVHKVWLDVVQQALQAGGR
jgi:hypothetical protein